MNENTCKHCGGKLIEKKTKRTAEQLKKPYFYTAYYYCPHCRKLYHDDKFKIVNATPLQFGFVDSDHTNYDVAIWTDGACVFNGTVKAKAAWAFVSDKTERAGRVIGKQTNNIAEGLAIYHALSWSAEKGYKKVRLHTDSQISLHNLQKPANMVKVNREIFEQIEEVIKKNGLKVTYIKVLGHSGEINNERADVLANSLATQS